MKTISVVASIAPSDAFDAAADAVENLRIVGSVRTKAMSDDERKAFNHMVDALSDSGMLDSLLSERIEQMAAWQPNRLLVLVRRGLTRLSGEGPIAFESKSEDERREIYKAWERKFIAIGKKAMRMWGPR